MMFRQSLSECRIPVPEKLERMIGALGRVGHEEMLDAVTRHTYRQPITQLLPDMEDGIGQGFINGWHQLSEGRSPELPFAERSYPETGERQRRVEIGSLLNA